MPDSDRVIQDILAKERGMATRRLINSWFQGVCVVISSLSIVILAILLGTIAYQGYSALNMQFLSGEGSSEVEEAGIYSALVGTVWVCIVCAGFTIPLGIGTAIFLEEYRPRSGVLARIHGIIQLNIANLAGVPSIVYGIIGVAAFVYMFNAFDADDPAFEVGLLTYNQFRTADGGFIQTPVDKKGVKLVAEPGLKGYYGGELVELNVIPRGAPSPKDEETKAITVRAGAKGSPLEVSRWYHMKIPFGNSVLAAGLTLMLVVLPVAIIASQESIRSVPDSLREAAYGLGATRWQVVWNVTLPSAIPGIMTGLILSMSRAIGEAAPMLMVSGAVYVAAPHSLMSDFTVMPLQIYRWATLPNDDWRALAGSGIVVLLLVLLFFNTLAVVIRYRFQQTNQ